MTRDRIDEIDRKILRILQSDGRASMKDIADKIGKLSKVAVSYRVKRLRKTGVIQGFQAKIDPGCVGQGFLFVSRLSIAAKGAREGVIAKKIAALDGVQSVFQTFGDYDILVIGRARDAVAGRDMIQRMLRMKGVSDSTTIVAHTVAKQSLDVAL
ncbi:Lrp/AsnC family transcriptional regulator [bacterium]|nr:MAG: Lrp/AsnC family transcriptional regulator [bacterium]